LALDHPEAERTSKPAPAADSETAQSGEQSAEQGAEALQDVEVLEPGPQPPDEPRRGFARGRDYPRAIAWLGFSSFWAHLWHLAASVIATEDIDARDWMSAQTSEALTDAVASLLGAGDSGASLTERLGRDLWIDFVADTGDDGSVSEAVADMIFRRYRLPDDDGLIVAPRGDVLLFGGDTAYPVATELELHNRVCVPFNRVLRPRQDGRMRALLGIPGNHDWYDGLDGFARMFRARRGSVDRASTMPDESIDRGGQILHLVRWVEAFRVGHYIAKRPALPLYGYVPVQSASYFALRLAPALDVWGVDRQLRTVDYTQRSFFLAERDRAAQHGILLVLADPLFHMLEPHDIGFTTLRSLELSLEDDAPLVLTGDLHHYCRQRIGDALHVIAGGGGAFLHPARLRRSGIAAPDAEFPGPKASAALALEVPWQIAFGRSGFVVHAAVLVLYTPLFFLLATGHSIALACIGVAVVGALSAGLVGGWRKRRRRGIALLALGCGAVVAALPLASQALVARLGLASWPSAALAVLAALLPAVLTFGAYLTALTLLGLEHMQAFSALAHPGYKHFVRLRVRQDGSVVDGWVIGKIDPLNQASSPLLVDRFRWHNPKSVKATRAAGEPRKETP
jgi:hypothetical protein